MIRIVNLRNYKLHENEVLIKVDRSTCMGNPFIMRNESMRDEVCDAYEEYFYRRLYNCDTMKRIIRIAKKHDVALGCWCYPKRCHAETIKNFIEEELK
jgi:hypothetical protein